MLQLRFQGFPKKKRDPGNEVGNASVYNSSYYVLFYLSLEVESDHMVSLEGHHQTIHPGTQPS